MNRFQSVTAVNSYIHRLFVNDSNMKLVFVTGEISNYRWRPRHQYFSLKDDQSKLNAVIWASVFSKVKFKLKNGMKVNVIGRIGTYPRNGEYQIYIWRIQPNGVGQLYTHLKQVQKVLAQEGLFASEHKRPLPMFPKRIAVVTSTSGAVIRDIINNVRERYPIAQIVLYPASVQGKKAIPSLIQRLEQISANHDCNEVIIGRGGGSLEDLWAFESTSVARAIYRCSVPVISSVGHGTDHTTADLVADRAVSTPTEAGVVATPVRLLDLLANLQDCKKRITDVFRKKISVLEQNLRKIQQSAVFQHPQQLYAIYDQELDSLHDKLFSRTQSNLDRIDKKLQGRIYRLRNNSPVQLLSDRQQRVQLLRQRMQSAVEMKFSRIESRYRSDVATLNQLSPLKRMSQGYSVVTKDNRVVTDSRHVKAGDKVKLFFQNGQKRAEILDNPAKK